MYLGNTRVNIEYDPRPSTKRQTPLSLIRKALLGRVKYECVYVNSFFE